MFVYTPMGTMVNLDRFDGVITSKMKCGRACVYAVRGTGEEQVRMPIGIYATLADADYAIYRMAEAMNTGELEDTDE